MWHCQYLKSPNIDIWLAKKKKKILSQGPNALCDWYLWIQSEYTDMTLDLSQFWRYILFGCIDLKGTLIFMYPFYLYINSQCMSVFLVLDHFLKVISEKNLSAPRTRTSDLLITKWGRYRYATTICWLPNGLKVR